MDDALLVRRFERLGDLLRNRQCLVKRNRPLCDEVRQRWPVHQLQHEGADAFGFFQAVDRGDVRMVE